MFLCRQRFYSDLRRLKKLGASGFFGGPVTFQIYQWLQQLNVEGCVIYKYIFQVITTKSRLGNNQAKEWYSRIYKKYIFVRK